MKRILLTSTALVAFAGAAAAEVTWSGDAEIGYNDKVEDGFYYSAGLKINGSMELNAGMEAGFVFDVDVDFDNNGTAGNDRGTWDAISFDASDYYVYLKTDVAGMYFGDTKTAAERVWEGTTNMEQDAFIEDGDVDDGHASDCGGSPADADKCDAVDAVLRGDLMMGGVDASVSYLLYTEANPTEDDQRLGGLQVALKGEYGAFTYGMAYQEEDTDVVVNNAPIDELLGVYVGGSFSGADVKLAYVTNNTTKEDSIGIEVAYPFGPVKATAFYSAESATDDNYGIALAYENGPAKVDFWYHDGNDQEIGLEGSYDLGNGLKLYAGYIQNDGDSDATETYIAGEYDLGGGAGLLVSYGDAGSAYTGAKDEIGDNKEVNEGTTVAVTFEF